MQHHPRWLVLIVLSLLVLQIAGCSSSTPAAEKEVPASVEATEQEGINRVTLTEKAAQRLAIETDVIREETVNGAMRKVAPYSSIIYDTHGGTWLYVNTAPLTFVRQSITIESIDGDKAILIEGPDVGTQVATVGVAELYGTDTGVGK